MDVVTSSATLVKNQESTILTNLTLLSHGLIITGLPD